MKFITILFSVVAVSSLIAQDSLQGEDRKMSGLTISSAAFPNNGTIPSKYTCDGADVSPPLTIGGVPKEAGSLALIVDDPDAPAGTWVHWVVWNIGPGTVEIPENSVPKGAVLGTNDFRKQAYGGPCPPSGTHRYFFKLFALDAPPSLKPGAAKARLEEAMKGHIVAQAEMIGLYRRR